MSTLPNFSQLALDHSNALCEVIKKEIQASNNILSFARFMELALYAPGLGYYSAGSHKLGAKGDFVTAPEISPLFARCIAKQYQQISENLSGCSILEVGAGSGKLAKEILEFLSLSKTLPEKYYILEISADLRERQQTFLQKIHPDLFSRVEWLDTLPLCFRGMILANEVMDALPVNIIQVEESELTERCVTLCGNHLNWKNIPASSEMTKKLKDITKLPNGYISEINLLIEPWIKSLADILEQGVLMLFDYGYGYDEYYHSDRTTGTLMCYYQHHKHSDPFKWIGLQDITAHVNFTEVAESGLGAGLSLSGYTTQAGFLLSCGITETIEKADAVKQYQLSQEIKRLILPSEMGEAIKVMAFHKKLDLPLIGFDLQDRRRDL